MSIVRRSVLPLRSFLYRKLAAVFERWRAYALMMELDTFFRLGNAAVFLIGGQTRDSEPVPILLRSGDIVIMSGPACRRAYHGELLTHLWG